MSDMEGMMPELTLDPQEMKAVETPTLDRKSTRLNSSH